MKLNADKIAFGRHETFALRYSWLAKGFQAISDEGFDITDADNATVRLGVGKNMVAAIRYWLRACQMMEQSAIAPSKLGKLILADDGYDPYLEDEATIWLIHWLLATNSEQATAWFWFFNKFHRPEFTGQELQSALSDFLKEAIIKGKRPATNTLKSDAALIPRMYAGVRQTRKVSLEESLDSPLALLRLITQSSGGMGFVSKSEARPGLPVGIFAFAVTQLMQHKKVTSIPIEELLYSRDEYAAPGSIFRLTETDLITKLEQMVYAVKGMYEIRETAGIHQLYMMTEVVAEDYLMYHYLGKEREVAA
jgi:hypothetical protein